MRITSVLLGFLLIVSFSQAQMENLLGLDLESVYDMAETMENAIGETLTQKLVGAVREAIAGTFTPQKALKLLESLTDEERDGGAQGIVILMKELEKFMSTPGTKDQLKAGLKLAPLIMRLAIKSSLPTRSAESKDNPAEADPVPNEEGKQNDTTTNTENEEEMDTDAMQNLVGSLLESGNFPDELLQVMETLVDGSENYEEDGDEMALDDESTAKLSQLKNQQEANAGGTVQMSNAFKEDEIEDSAANGGSKTQRQTDEL